eukprot:1152079-Pelagomonas_calceolata.AAC.4
MAALLTQKAQQDSKGTTEDPRHKTTSHRKRTTALVIARHLNFPHPQSTARQQRPSSPLRKAH